MCGFATIVIGTFLLHATRDLDISLGAPPPLRLQSVDPYPCCMLMVTQMYGSLGAVHPVHQVKATSLAFWRRRAGAVQRRGAPAGKT